MTIDEINSLLEPRVKLFKDWIEGDEKRKFYLIGGIVILFIYFISLGQEKVAYVYKGDNHRSFDSDGVIENPYKTIYDGKMGVLEETKDRLLSENRKLREEIEGLKIDFKGFMTNLKNSQVKNAPEKIKETVGVQKNQVEGSNVNFGDSPLQGMKAEGADQKAKIKNQSISKKTFKKRTKKVKLAKSRVVFPVKLESKEIEAGIVIGAGSWAKGTIIAGAEIPQSKTYPIVIQLDQSFSMANQTRISLVGCLMVAKATSQMATRHVEIQPETMACFSQSGQYFERKINGWGTDSLDNNFGVKGEFRSNIGRYAQFSMIKSLLDGVGEIVKRQSQQIGGVDPNRPDLLIQDGGAQTASQVTDFLMKQAKQLLPTLEISSGREVYITMKESVRMPYEFFNNNGEGDEEFNYSFDILR